MDDYEGTYAPQSPDLSGFQSYEDSDPFPSSYYPPQPQPVQNSYNAPSLLEQQNTNHDPFVFTSQPQQMSQSPYQHPGIPTHNGKSKELDPDYMPESTLASKGGAGAVGRKTKKAKAEEEYCAKPAPGVEEGIEVKTKFPVARIKRIMQADEDVGKVAQVTPTAVCTCPCPSSTFPLPYPFTSVPRVDTNMLFNHSSQSPRTLHDQRCN